MNRFFGKLLVSAMGCMVVILPWGEGYARNEFIRALWPSTLVQSMDREDHAGDGPDEPHITRIGTVVFATDVFMPHSQDAGQRIPALSTFRDTLLTVTFFPNREYRVRIDSETRIGTDAFTLGGQAEKQDISSFTMTVTATSYLITFQDLDTAIVYRVVGDTGTGRGTVTEIDLTKTPPIKYLPPVVPAP